VIVRYGLPTTVLLVSLSGSAIQCSNVEGIAEAPSKRGESASSRLCHISFLSIWKRERRAISDSRDSLNTSLK
jgi:hypothetical protein